MLTAAISLIMLMLSLTSCASKTVYTMPELYMPDFPAPDGWILLDENREEVTDNNTNIVYVLVPYEWVSGPLLDFKIAYDETCLYYETLKKAYVGEQTE